MAFLVWRVNGLVVGVTALIAAAAAVQGCGGDDGTSSDFNPPGKGGSAGTAGAAGSAGKAGAAGSAGAAGKAGAAGAAGATGGAGGAAGAIDAGPDAPADGGPDVDAGCTKDTDCSATPDTPYCQISTGKCVPCEEGVAQHACANGKACCAGECIDTVTDVANCGACGQACALANAQVGCAASQCVVTSCNAGFADCDLVAANGCEAAEGGCVCAPGAQEACYTGPAGTENVGECKGGTRTCDASGTAWSACVGEVVPAGDSCLDSLDNDCNGVVNDGVAANAPGCVCLPNAVAACYEGPPGTENVGPCKAGTQTCVASGLGYGLCENEVLPVLDVCANGVDDDCNGAVDDSLDEDGDGWKRCDGDCCDRVGPVCSDPKLVNPGAFEVDGNSVDDDCDGTVDTVAGACDSALSSNSSAALDYAKAIDLCQTTTESPPLAQKKWGVISAWLQRPDGTGAPVVESRAIRGGFGNVIVPKKGARIAVLSTGNAADLNDGSPAYAAFQGGQNKAVTSGVPSDWLAANGNNFPNAPGCPEPQGGTTAYDPVMLKVRVRVPTNAQSFSVNTYFFSSEYPEWVCSPYNDFFVALLTSGWAGSPANPTDKNLAFYDPPPAGAPYYPVGVNLAFGNTGLFRQCLNGATGCGGGSVAGTTNVCQSTAELAGTGFDILNPVSQFAGDPGYCGTNNMLGGGTGWLTTTGNVVPGEVIEVRFAIWDTGDPWYDSVVLLDNFVWSVNASQPGTGG